MGFECPTCSKELETELGMKQHHAKVHGESLVESECEVCGQEFKDYGEQERRTCSHECLGELKSEEYEGWEVDWVPSGEDHNRHGATHSEKTRQLLSEAVSGENNGRWKPGEDPDRGRDWPEVREKILERDGRQCQNCGIGGDALLDVHHITPVREFDCAEEANQHDNLIVLCRSCHMRVEHGSISCPEVTS